MEPLRVGMRESSLLECARKGGYKGTGCVAADASSAGRASLGWTAEGGCPHTKLFWLQGLGDHYLALEVFYHVGIEADFGGLFRDRHGIDFVLQF